MVVLVIKNPPANGGHIKYVGSIPGLGISPAGGHGNSFQYSCLENHHGQRSPASYSPWGCKESDMTEQLSTRTQTHRDQTCSRPGSLLTHELSTENRFWEQLSPCGMEETSGRNSRWWFLWPKSWTPWTSLNAFVPTILLLTVKQPKVTYLQCFIPWVGLLDIL